MNDPRPGELDELDELHDERLSELYRTARDVEPPAWLDHRILRAAQPAMGTPRPTGAMPWRRWRSRQFWTAPVALAATVALVVGLLRWTPPAGDLGGMPAAVEEKAAQSPAGPAAEADPAPGPATLPPAKRNEQQLMRSGTRPMEPMRSESFEAAPARRQPADEEAVSVRERMDRRPPAEWRAEIAELRRQGRHAEAEARLAEFRRQYPDEPSNEVEPPR